MCLRFRARERVIRNIARPFFSFSKPKSYPTKRKTYYAFASPKERRPARARLPVPHAAPLEARVFFREARLGGRLQQKRLGVLERGRSAPLLTGKPLVVVEQPDALQRVAGGVVLRRLPPWRGAKAGDLAAASRAFRRAKALCPASRANALLKIQKKLDQAERFAWTKSQNEAGEAVLAADAAYRAATACLEKIPKDVDGAARHLRAAQRLCPPGRPAAMAKIERLMESVERKQLRLLI